MSVVSWKSCRHYFYKFYVHRVIHSFIKIITSNARSMEELLGDLEKFQISQIPPCVYYIPNFITESEELAIIDRVNSAPKPKWTQLLNRRLQNWGGIPHPKGMIAEEIPKWLQSYLDRINSLQLMNGNAPNHVLVNEYFPGQGIMPHVDGSLFYPTITTISCGSHTVLNFKVNLNDEGTENDSLNYSLLLERRSLLIVQKEMYEKFLHYIEELTNDTISLKIVNIDKCSQNYDSGQILERKTRISLTIRHVPKTTKIKIQF